MSASGGVRRYPRLLKRMLAQPASSETPKRSGSASKRPIQPLDDEHSTAKRQKTEKDFVDSAIRAVTTDEHLATLLNIAVFQNGGDPEKYLVIVTTKMVYYHEPARHMSHLRLVFSPEDGSYYIQVTDYNTCLIVRDTKLIGMYHGCAGIIAHCRRGDCSNTWRF